MISPRFAMTITVLTVVVLTAFSQGHLISHKPPRHPMDFPRNPFPVPNRPSFPGDLKHYLRPPKFHYCTALEHSQCDVWCRLKNGGLTCCEGIVQDPLGRCPVYTNDCRYDIYRSRRNEICSYDMECPYDHKCCFDACLPFKTCRPRRPNHGWPYGYKAKNMTSIQDDKSDTVNVTTTETNSEE